ncbi:MAG TPA: tetratricopeptide repeat protein [Pyrinomonadaceae bacterium]|jgi:tetratricopeptide (TPR) repeat protein|nr:tetratricopeptide repeat protein [Pyrinomonadaceae bacterium]
MKYPDAPRALLASLLLLAAFAPAGAQQSSAPDNSPDLSRLMQHRMEMSNRSVDETQKRRFEEGKSDSRFPSDANRSSAKPGVVRAVSPAEQKALARNERGLEYFSKSKFEQALHEYEAALKLYPALAAAHNNMGSAYFALARYEEAARSFAEAARLDPAYAQARFNLALAYVKLGREREAGEALDAASRAYTAEGDEHLAAGRLKEAEESFRALLQIDPEYAPAFERLGLVYNAARRFDEAAASFKRALQKNADDAPSLEGLAEACMGLRDYAPAAEAATRAARLRPGSANAHYLSGLAHASLGQRDAALADLSRLQQLKADAPAKLLSDFIEKKALDKK